MRTTAAHRSRDRSIWWALATVVGFVAAAGCSDGGAGSAETAPAPATASTDVSPVTAGSSDDSSGSASDPSTTDTSAGSVAPSSELEAVAAKEIVTRSPDATGAGVLPDGFTTVSVRVTSAAGEVCEVCMWLADEPAERSRGLMGVTDLGEPVGMVFRWSRSSTSNFFMFGTPTPLSIAWFASDGGHVAQLDMEPCRATDSGDCDRYSAGVEYNLAIEMFQGQLGAIGIGPGSRAALLAGTESPTCLIQR